MISLNPIPPIKIPRKFQSDPETYNFFTQLTRSTYQIWYYNGGQNGGIIPDDRISETSVTQHQGAIDHGSIAGLGDDDHVQYHNDARALTWIGTRSTTDLPEGINLYYTQVRFDSAFAAKDSDDLTEGGTNLYYTTERREEIEAFSFFIS